MCLGGNQRALTAQGPRKVERVQTDVRMERRLAKVQKGIADFKRIYELDLDATHSHKLIEGE